MFFFQFLPHAGTVEKNTWHFEVLLLFLSLRYGADLCCSRLVFLWCIDIGALGVPTRCFILNTPPEVCKHLNFVRQNSTKGAVRRIPDVGFNVYKSKFSAPTVSEGFAEITEVDFYPIFDKHSYKDEFMQWTEGWKSCQIEGFPRLLTPIGNAYVLILPTLSTTESVKLHLRFRSFL